MPVSIESVFNDAFVPRVLAAIIAGVTEAVVLVENDAVAKCPVDTGRLRASITHKVSPGIDGIVGGIGTNVEYAPFVEYGTISQAAKPFLRPAGIENEVIAGYVIQRSLAKVIK